MNADSCSIIINSNGTKVSVWCSSTALSAGVGKRALLRLSRSLARGPAGLTIYPRNGWLAFTDGLVYFTIFWHFSWRECPPEHGDHSVCRLPHNNGMGLGKEIKTGVCVTRISHPTVIIYGAPTQVARMVRVSQHPTRG